MLGATFSTMSVSKEVTQELSRTLTPELAEIYKNIASERRNIYLYGLLIGLILAFVLLKMRIIPAANLYHRIAVSLAVTITVSALVYSLTPKSDYMLRHLKTPEQTVAWLNVYKNMKQSYIWGFVLGSLISVPLALSFCA
jgi:hypothetical protein